MRASRETLRVKTKVAALLPSSVGELQDAEAIALLQKMQRCVVPVPFQPGKTAVVIAC
jgi:hypothetical protein